MEEILYGNAEYGIPTEKELDDAFGFVWDAKNAGNENESCKSTAEGTIAAAKMLAKPFAQAVGEMYK